MQSRRGDTLSRAHRLLCLAALPILALLLGVARVGASSNRPEPSFSEIRFLMDTVVRIQVWGDKKSAERAGTAAYQAMQEVATFSDVFNPDSEVSHINQAAGTQAVPISAGLFDLLERTIQISRLSGGALDPTIGPLVNLWGISRQNPHVPAPKDIALARRLVGYQDLVLDQRRRTAYLRRPGMALDLGATAKGYAVDAAGKRLQGDLKTGTIAAALIDAGGDVWVSGKRPGGGRWRVGVRHPRQPGVVGAVELGAGAAVTSGDYERFFFEKGVRYSHLLDPHTGYPATEFAGVTIVAPDSTLGDALSTAVFVLGPQRGAALLRTLHLGAVFISPNLATTTTGQLNFVPANRL